MPYIFRASFWIAVVFALVMALLPQPPQLPGYASDKVQHILAFAALAALGSIAYPSASSIRLLAWLSAFGALIEAFQAIPSLNRDSDIVDWVADTCAAAVVLGPVRWWRRRAQRGDQ
jgi:VanZ family protein